MRALVSLQVARLLARALRCGACPRLPSLCARSLLKPLQPRRCSRVTYLSRWTLAQILHSITPLIPCRQHVVAWASCRCFHPATRIVHHPSTLSCSVFLASQSSLQQSFVSTGPGARSHPLNDYLIIILPRIGIFCSSGSTLPPG